MNRLELLFYPDGTSGPVRDYLQALSKSRDRAYAKLSRDLLGLKSEGLRCPWITVRPLGEGLWELKRLYDGIQYRLFFCVVEGRAWLLHAIEKKSEKTPLSDIRLARERMRGLGL
jgi:phage-related protein